MVAFYTTIVEWTFQACSAGFNFQLLVAFIITPPTSIVT